MPDISRMVRGPTSLKVAPFGPQTSNEVPFHEPANMDLLLSTGKFTTVPTNGQAFGACVFSISPPGSNGTTSANLQLAGRGRSGLRVCFPSSVIAGFPAVDFAFTLPGQTQGTAGTDGAGLSSLVTGVTYLRWKQRYDEQWTNSGNAFAGVWNLESVAQVYDGPGAVTQQNIWGYAQNAIDAYLNWNIFYASTNRVIPGPGSSGFNVSEPLGNLAGPRRFGTVPAQTPFGIHARLRGFDLGFAVNINYPNESPESFDYTQTYSQAFGGLITDEVVWQEHYYITGGSSPSAITFSWTGVSGNSPDQQVALAQSIGAKIKPYIFEGTNGVAMTPMGNWANNTEYSVGQGTYDTVAARWYVCIVAIGATSNSAPRDDPAHWAQQTYSPDIYNTLTAPSSGDGSVPGSANALTLMYSIIDGYAKHYNVTSASAWSATTTYTANQTVEYLNQFYTCWTNAPEGTKPTDLRYWILTQGIHEYIIANEALQPNGAAGTGFMPSPWYAFLGATWVSLAAQRLHVDDPNAFIQVNLNNSGLNTSSTVLTTQQTNAVALATSMIAAGGIGTRQLVFCEEGHFNCSEFNGLPSNAAGSPQFTVAGLQLYFNKLTALDVLVGLSEFDMLDDTNGVYTTPITINDPAAGIAAQTDRDAMVGANVSLVLSACAPYATAGMLKEIIFWEYSDRNSWRNWPPNGSPNIAANLGDWVSEQLYAINVGVYDTVAAKWYYSKNSIQSTTRPGLDSTNWGLATLDLAVVMNRIDGLLGRLCLVDQNFATKPALTSVITWLNSLPFEREQHVCEMVVTPESTPGASNGSAQIWVDGNLVIATSGVQWLGINNILGYPILSSDTVYGATGGTNPPTPAAMTVPRPSIYYEIDEMYAAVQLHGYTPNMPTPGTIIAINNIPPQVYDSSTDIVNALTPNSVSTTVSFQLGVNSGGSSPYTYYPWAAGGFPSNHGAYSLGLRVGSTITAHGQTTTITAVNTAAQTITVSPGVNWNNGGAGYGFTISSTYTVPSTAWSVRTDTGFMTRAPSDGGDTSFTEGPNPQTGTGLTQSINNFSTVTYSGHLGDWWGGNLTGPGNPSGDTTGLTANYTKAGTTAPTLSSNGPVEWGHGIGASTLGGGTGWAYQRLDFRTSNPFSMEATTGLVSVGTKFMELQTLATLNDGPGPTENHITLMVQYVVTNNPVMLQPFFFLQGPNGQSRNLFPNQNGAGTPGTSIGVVSDGNKHVIEELFMPETTPGQGDGAGMVFVDGLLITAYNNLNWLGVGNPPGFGYALFNQIWGGGVDGGDQGTPLQNQWLWYDRHYIALN